MPTGTQCTNNGHWIDLFACASLPHVPLPLGELTFAWSEAHQRQMFPLGSLIRRA